MPNLYNQFMRIDEIAYNRQFSLETNALYIWRSLKAIRFKVNLKFIKTKSVLIKILENHKSCS